MNVIKYNVNSGEVCQIGRQYEYGKTQVIFEGYQVTDSANEIYFKFVGRTEESKYLIPIVDMTLDITQQLTKHVGQFSCQLEEMNTEGTLVSQSPVFYVAVKRSIKVGADYEVQDPRLETIYQKYNEMYNIISQTNETSLANESQRQAEWLTLKQEVSDAINGIDGSLDTYKAETTQMLESNLAEYERQTTSNINTALKTYETQSDANLNEKFQTYSAKVSSDINRMFDDSDRTSKEKIDEYISEIEQRRIAGEFNGSDGYTPVKGKDYFTESEIVQFKKDVTPKKSIDYFTDSEISQIQNEVSSGAIGEFRAVVQTETDNFNSNAENKTAEFNAQTEQIETDISELKSDLGNVSNDLTMLRAQTNMLVNESDILGLQVDYKNKTFTRLAGAVGKTAGTDFDAFGMYGDRKKCIVADDGTIVKYYGDDGYVEDGSIGQVMVKQPKFYYLVAPLEYDPIDKGIGYHLRKANYYITSKKITGFKLHPAFYDASGNEVDYILIGAYEGSLYDTSASAYITDDSQVMNASEDLFCSIAGVHPASGLTQNLTRPNIETMCKNRGTGFHSLNIKAMSAEQILMMIELGTLNFQSAIGNGITGNADNSAYSCASYTGSTASLGNGTGIASSTNDYTGTAQTGNGKTSICYRGVENHWGNIYKFVYGVNIWGNGQMRGGQPYICKDFNYAESKNSDNYEGAGFTVTNTNGYINAMGYSTKCDWLFMPSEVGGNSSLPVGDYTYVAPDLNVYRIARLGGYWNNGLGAGGFCWGLDNGVGSRSRNFGGRLLYVPTANI